MRRCGRHKPVGSSPSLTLHLVQPRALRRREPMCIPVLRGVRVQLEVVPNHSLTSRCPCTEHSPTHSTQHTAIVKPTKTPRQLDGMLPPFISTCRGPGRIPSVSLACPGRLQRIAFFSPAVPYYDGLQARSCFLGRISFDRAVSRNSGQVSNVVLRLKGACELHKKCPCTEYAMCACIGSIRRWSHAMAIAWPTIPPFQPYQSAAVIARGSQTETTA